MGRLIMVKVVHGNVDGLPVTVVPGDVKPDWVSNPRAYVEEPDAPVESVEDAPVVEVVAPAEGETVPAVVEPVEGETVPEDQVEESAPESESVSEGESAPEEPAPAPKKRGRPAKKPLAEQARELGIEVDPEWSEAEIEARVLAAKG